MASRINITNIFTTLGNLAKPLYLGSAVTAPVIGIFAFIFGYLLIKRFKGKEKTHN